MIVDGSLRPARIVRDHGGDPRVREAELRIGDGAAMTERFPYELRLPLAPYRFEWRDEAAVDASKHATDAYSEERYTHADGTTTVIREYRSDGTFHVMSDRGEIELIDNAQDPYASDPVSVVRLP